MPMCAPGTAADDQKGGAQARMMGQGGPPKGNWSGLLASVGLSAPVGEIVWDMSYRTFPGAQVNPEFVFVRGEGLSEDSAITRGLQNIVSLMGGHVRSFGKDGFTVSPLLMARGPRIGQNESNGYVRKSELFVSPNMFMPPQYNRKAQHVDSADDMVIAARVSGKPPEGQDKGANLIYVADLDMISDQFFAMRRQVVDPNFRFDNVTFALNCIDALVGDESLIELRKRRPILRKLTKVEEAQGKFEMEWQQQKASAEKAAADSLKAAQDRLEDAVAKIRTDISLDTQAKNIKIVEVQQNENRKLDRETVVIEQNKNRLIEKAQHDRDAARSSTHDSYRFITLLLALLPGLLLGLFTYFRRGTRAAAIVPQNRQVGGSN